MRDIKFRAWNKVEDIMIYDVDLYSGGMPFQGTNDNPYDFDMKTLGQYTNLKDKNGKEIYEGDILKSRTHMYSDKSHEVSDVYYSEGKFMIRTVLLSIVARGTDFAPEIIGNIHENPELLDNKE